MGLQREPKLMVDKEKINVKESTTMTNTKPRINRVTTVSFLKSILHGGCFLLTQISTLDGNGGDSSYTAN